jgi:AraC family transcriptional regulator
MSALETGPALGLPAPEQRANNGHEESAGKPRVEARVRGGLAAWQQRTVVTYIEEHLAEPISLATLAQLVRLSPYHFSHAFKQSFGTPPHRYHNGPHIARPKILLAELLHR